MNELSVMLARLRSARSVVLLDCCLAAELREQAPQQWLEL